MFVCHSPSVLLPNLPPSKQGYAMLGFSWWIKKDSGVRPILDLRGLNRFLVVSKFYMIFLGLVMQLLKLNLWFIIIDLKDAYFHISIHQQDYKYL